MKIGVEFSLQCAVIVQMLESAFFLSPSIRKLYLASNHHDIQQEQRG